MTRSTALRLAAFAVSAFLTGACATQGGGHDATAAKLYMITADEFAYAPSTLMLQAGERATLRLQNRGQLLHDVTIPGIPVRDVVIGASANHAMARQDHAPMSDTQLHIAAVPGKAADVSFTPTQPGEYDSYCSEPGHRDAGMHGRLIVR